MGKGGRGKWRGKWRGNAGDGKREGRSIKPSLPRQLLAPFSSPGSEVSCRSPRESVSWPRSGRRRCRLRGAEKPVRRPRPPLQPHSRRTPTGVAVRTTCCRFRCGWWPRASLDRTGREEKAGGRTERRVRRRTGRDAGQNAQRAGACASGGGGGGGAAARAARAGRDGRRARDPPAGRPARPRAAPAPPRAGRRLSLPAPGHPGSRWGRGQRPVQRSPRGRAAGTVAFRGREGRELGLGG